ncbi:MAG: hypothetical protein HOQ10_03260 [Frateuria sp.]|uniref:hypothetical protein n=1 Tax=Frateuria sp. TaxID=2211372 RepID=UPI0017F45987|nr:hypothetical protein [Frateuria sp.]NUO71719.1 hypothetical protein [Frateuria sp.]NUR21939.1 hypothetical protein [Frateuria sp.]
MHRDDFSSSHRCLAPGVPLGLAIALVAPDRARTTGIAAKGGVPPMFEADHQAARPDASIACWHAPDGCPPSVPG